MTADVFRCVATGCGKPARQLSEFCERHTPAKPIERDPNAAPDWAAAACRGMHPDIFYGPEGTTPGNRPKHRTEEARRICEACEIRAECLAWAIRTHETHGVWGGLTADERHAQAKARRLQRVELNRQQQRRLTRATELIEQRRTPEYRVGYRRQQA